MVNLKGKKCRYCGKPATHSEVVTALRFPEMERFKKVFYLCDSPVWGECREARHRISQRV